MSDSREKGKLKLTIHSSWVCFEDLCNTSSPLTARAYWSDVKEFAKYRGTSPQEALFDLLAEGPECARHIATAWSRAMIRRLAGNTVSRRMSALKSFVTHAAMVGLVDWRLNVVSTHRQKASLSKEAKVATAERDMSGLERADYEKVIAALDKIACRPAGVGKQEEERIAAIRDVAIISILENPALRRSEVCALDIRDVQLSESPAVTFIGKGRSEPETMPLPRRVAGFISRWMTLRDDQPDGPVFTRFRRPNFGPAAGTLRLTSERMSGSGIYDLCINRRIEILGREKKGERKRLRMNPHSLRHTGITKLGELHASGKVTLKQAMAVSRHKKPDTFLRYVDTTKAAARQAVNAMENMR